MQLNTKASNNFKRKENIPKTLDTKSISSKKIIKNNVKFKELTNNINIKKHSRAQLDDYLEGYDCNHNQ